MYIYWLRETGSNERFNLPNTLSFHSCEASCEELSLCLCVWEWILENHSDSHTKTISVGLFLDHFIHILQLPLVFFFMWGTTSRYPTPTTPFIITGCCLATDKGPKFWGGMIKEESQNKLNQMKRCWKTLLISALTRVCQQWFKVFTHRTWVQLVPDLWTDSRRFGSVIDLVSWQTLWVHTVWRAMRI